MSASSSFIAKNRAGILGVSRLAQTIFLMACSADPWRTADGLRFGTSPVSRQTNEALRPSDGNPEVIGWSVGLVLTNDRSLSGLPRNRNAGMHRSVVGAVSIGSFEVSRWRLRRMR